MDISRYYSAPEELPLDSIREDGGFCAIFRTIACVGDSLASGEFESRDAAGNPGYHDMFEYSWGQYIGRMCGSKVYSFSRGGMTAKEYMEGYAQANGFWDPEKKAQAYIVALGVNDVVNIGQPVGTLEDAVAGTPGTFAGWYGALLNRYRALQPEGRFFLLTMPRDERGDACESNRRRAAHAALLHQIAARYPYTYVVDLNRYGPVYDATFRKTFNMGGHMNPMGYVLTAKMVASYIDYIIRRNPADFSEVPFIGTEWSCDGRKG